MTDTIRRPFIGVIGLQDPKLRAALLDEWHGAGREGGKTVLHLLQMGVILSYQRLARGITDLIRICPPRLSDIEKILGDGPCLLRTLYYIDDRDGKGDASALWESIRHAIGVCGGKLDALQLDGVPAVRLLELIREHHPSLRIICRLGPDEIAAARRGIEGNVSGQANKIVEGLFGRLLPALPCIDDVLLPWFGKPADEARLSPGSFAASVRVRCPGLGVAIGDLSAAALGHTAVAPLLRFDPPVSFQGMDRLRRGGEHTRIDPNEARRFVRLAARCCVQSS